MTISSPKLPHIARTQGATPPCRHNRKVALAQERASRKKSVPVVSWNTARIAFHKARKKPSGLRAWTLATRGVEGIRIRILSQSRLQRNAR
jgi:hypothetical protein